MRKSLVSVIVPVFNGERYLAFAIQSIFKQDYYPFEVIVVDDGSVDQSAEIARYHSSIHYIYQSNQGVSVARNVGIAAARGEFIAFLDQDDLWTPNKLSVQVDYLLKHPQISYTLASQQIFLESGTNSPPWLKEELLQEEHTGFLLGTLVACKAVFKKIGDFDPNYKHSSDSDWFFRAKDAGIPMSILPETLLYKRIHGFNASYETQVMHSEILRVAKTSIDRQRNPSFVKE